MRNIGNFDRLTRFIIGFVPLLTGLAGYCPLYHLLRISTSPAKKYT